MQDKNDLKALLLLLLSITILLDIIFLHPNLTKELGFTSSIFMIFIFALLALSVIVSLHFKHSRGFFYIFWLPIIAGLIGSFSFYLFLAQRHESFNIFKFIYMLLGIYSIFIIYYTNFLAKASSSV